MWHFKICQVCLCFIFFGVFPTKTEENWSPFEVVVEEMVYQEIVENINTTSLKEVVEGSCPDKCLCQDTTVRCMLLDWSESMSFDAVPSATEIL